jgi:hypothetical protein
VLLGLSAWVVQWQLAPTWIVGSASGLQTLFQAIPAIIVAIFALVFGSLFLIAQQVASAWGPRSVPLLLSDRKVRFILVAALLLAVAGLLLTGQVPRNLSAIPPKTVTAGAATVALATVLFILAATFALNSLLRDYTSPVEFKSRLLAEADKADWQEPDGLVRNFRQALRFAARRGDSRDFHVIADGILELLEVQLKRAAHDANTEQSIEFVAKEINSALVRGGEDALRARALWRDLNRIVTTFDKAIDACLDAKRFAEARILVEGLVELGCFARQIDEGDALRDWFLKPAQALSHLEARAESSCGARCVAAAALAGWAIVTAKLAVVDVEQSEAFQLGIRAIGREPPWEDASKLVRSGSLNPRWDVLRRGEKDTVADVLSKAREQGTRRKVRPSRLKGRRPKKR